MSQCLQCRAECCLQHLTRDTSVRGMMFLLCLCSLGRAQAVPQLTCWNIWSWTVAPFSLHNQCSSFSKCSSLYVQTPGIVGKYWCDRLALWMQEISSLFMTHPTWEVPATSNIVQKWCHSCIPPWNFLLSTFFSQKEFWNLLVYLVMSMAVPIANAMKTSVLAKLVLAAAIYPDKAIRRHIPK